jgi:hypothetical protein
MGGYNENDTNTLGAGTTERSFPTDAIGTKFLFKSLDFTQYENGRDE